MLINDRSLALYEHVYPHVVDTIRKLRASGLSLGDFAFVILERSSADARAILAALGDPDTSATPGQICCRDMPRKDLDAALRKAASATESAELSNLVAVEPKPGALHVVLVDEGGVMSLSVEAEPKAQGSGQLRGPGGSS